MEQCIEYSDEVWAHVPGYEGLYLVSNLGRIMALNFGNKGKCKILKPTCAKSRYKKVGLRKNGKTKTYWLHIIVAMVFCENPEQKPFVDHISGQKEDCRASNLRYTSARENSRNPATLPNYRIRYHRDGEWQRRSEGQKRRFAQHPEDLKKMRDARGKNKRGGKSKGE